MKIKEYRITMPVSLEEYHLAQLYCTASASKNETGGGEGIEVVKNEPFNGVPFLGRKYNSGQYTYKIYHVASKVPSLIRLMAPKGSLEVIEESWNAYPYLKTIITNPGFMKDSFRIIIESLHIEDTGFTENALQLPEGVLKNRRVVHIDIANDPVSNSDYKTQDDPIIFKSKKTGRGPLTGDWTQEVKPVMTCYKLVTVEFGWFGLQTKMEKYIHKSERRLFTVFHRQIFCSIDEWYGLSLESIRKIENKTKEELDKSRNVGEVRGMKSDEVQ